MGLKILYEGKAKQLFVTESPHELIQLFKDDATAFDGIKHEIIAGKGLLNCAISSFIFEKLHAGKINSHFIRRLSDRKMLVHRLKMIPVEVVIRNVAAGSICTRLGLKEGRQLERPLVELFYKSDELHDPLINEDHARLFGWASGEELTVMRAVALDVNRILSDLMSAHGIRLIDFKLEFGRDRHGNILLGDEITPDGCRLWDLQTNRKLDKDIFRRDLGGLSEAYHEVASRLTVPVEYTDPS